LRLGVVVLCTPCFSVLKIKTQGHTHEVKTGRAGLISIGDLVKWRLKDAELESKVLRDMALTRMAAE